MSLEAKLITVAEKEQEIKNVVDATADAIRKNMYNPNLYDVNTYPLTINRYITPTSGTPVGASESSMLACTVDYIPCTQWQGKTLTLSHCTGWTVGTAFYDENKSFISAVQYSINNGMSMPITFVVPDNAIYMRISVDNNHMNEIKLEEGAHRTPYTPYGYYESYNAQDFPQKVEEVYNKGVQDDYDTFWDIYQQYGNRTFYSQGFAGEGWTKDNLKPKYPIVTNSAPNRSNGMFMYAQKLTEIMIPLYFYDTTSNSTFNTCTSLIKIGDDTGGGIWQTRNRTDSANFGSCSKLEEIRYIDYNEKGEYVPSEIGKSHSFSSCKVLSMASCKNIISHLVDYSGTSEKGTYTLTLHNDVKTQLRALKELAPSGSTWVDEISNRGWNLA